MPFWIASTQLAINRTKSLANTHFFYFWVLVCALQIFVWRRNRIYNWGRRKGLSPRHQDLSNVSRTRFRQFDFVRKRWWPFGSWFGERTLSNSVWRLNSFFCGSARPFNFLLVLRIYIGCLFQHLESLSIVHRVSRINHSLLQQRTDFKTSVRLIKRMSLLKNYDL